MKAMTEREYLQKMERRLVDDGKLIEAGWVGLCIAAVPRDASTLQLQEMRNAFFAGAQHLFSSIMTILEPGAEPTDKDLERMDLIDKELRAFMADFERRFIPTEGNA